MGKIMWKPGTFEYPIPAVMVTSGDMEKSNIMTVALLILILLWYIFLLEKKDIHTI